MRLADSTLNAYEGSGVFGRSRAANQSTPRMYLSVENSTLGDDILLQLLDDGESSAFGRLYSEATETSGYVFLGTQSSVPQLTQFTYGNGVVLDTAQAQTALGDLGNTSGGGVPSVFISSGLISTP